MKTNKQTFSIIGTIIVTLFLSLGFIIKTNAESSDNSVSVISSPSVSTPINITSLISSASLISYSPKNCNNYSCNQLQGFTITNDKLVFYLLPGGSQVPSPNNKGLINGFQGSNYSTAISGTPTFEEYDHGNDMTYNEEFDKIIIIGPNRYQDAYVLNNSNLSKEQTISLQEIGKIWAIGYDRFHNYYVTLSSDKIWLTDTDLNKKHGFSYSGEDNTSQGLEYHNGYIYWTLSEIDDNRNHNTHIYVYNAKLKKDGNPENGFGDKVASLYTNAGDFGEIESISFRNDEVYLGYSDWATQNTKFYHFPSNKISVPLDITVSYEDEQQQTKAVITSSTQLKKPNSFMISNNDYTLTKSYNTDSISESVEICDNYDNCKNIVLSHTNTSYINRQAQIVSFVNDSITKDYGDASFTNSATTTGDGTITYTSSNPSVAIVDNSGKITIKAAGETIITASASETDNYFAATNTYTLMINKANSPLPNELSQTLVGTIGEPLSSITFTTIGLEWKNPAQTITESEAIYQIYYTKNNDENNYLKKTYDIVVKGENSSDQPVEPDNPAEPDNPVEPDNPAEPDNPVEPDQPVKPDNPTEPDQLNQSELQINDKENDEPQSIVEGSSSKAPDTGEITKEDDKSLPSYLFGTVLFISLACVLTYTIRRIVLRKKINF